MIVLAVEASTYVGSVALWRDDELLGSREAAMRGAERERLMPEIGALLEQAGIPPAGVQRVMCGAGPGSFTSLRIAASIAKGMALGSGAELWSVPSLGLIVAAAPSSLGEGRYLSVLDALRGELYAALYEIDGEGAITEVERARLVAADRVEDVAAKLEARIIGPGQSFAATPHARGALRLTDGGGARSVDLDRWEPEYGRLAEAQVRWETAHGRPLPA
jgi:tRNA threonylcarbamoyladenosine biosynthesis protein TsaB